MNNLDHMKELVQKLNVAAKEYYQGRDEIMPNYEYDKLYDELKALEETTGVILGNSPTTNVGYETLSELPKEHHVAPMLSLDKTKEVPVLSSFLGAREGLLSLKLDGLSVIVTYENGVIAKALTRGNGEVGEVITNNARTFVNLPQRIPFTGQLVVRGEALIFYSDFQRLNEQTAEIAMKYKNPRNLCSGTVRQLNNEITAKRQVHYILYNVITTDYDHSFQTKEEELFWLKDQGFDVVPYYKVTSETVPSAVEKFSEEITQNDLPSDGLVITFNDIEYSKSLGRTAKFPKDSLAFKWKDEMADTTLREVEWSASRTGLINPVAIFDPVELEGTTVSRASIHNVSIAKELKLGIGDKLSVYKANMIIPQIHENTTKSNTLTIPETCPVCGEATQIMNENGSEVLMCMNPKCYAKRVKHLAHFASRNAMNIEGLSESTLEKLISRGWIHKVTDLFHLEQYREQIVTMEGFGPKSYDNLISSIETARHTTMPRLLYSLGIKGFGLSMAKLVCHQYPKLTLPEMKQLSVQQLCEIDGIGQVLAENFYAYFHEEEKNSIICDLWNEVQVETKVASQKAGIAGKTFVITGSLEHFENRDECKEKIEDAGGKVTGSVSQKTDYLVNNDSMSNSSKNKKAKELGIPIITEAMLLELIQE